ncbi:MAG: hypothetical protein AAB414_00740 [Patescibacteria group bacterium]
MKGTRVWGLGFSLITIFLLAFIFLYPIPYTLYPSHAQSPVPIGEKFGFGDIRSLGEATSKLVVPAFEVTTAIVIIYFLIGAFFYLKAGGNKEEIERARNMINHAIIGFLILIFAFLIIQFLLSKLFGINELRLIG